MNVGLIDKVVKWTVGEEASAIQNISMTTPILDKHFPLKPIWPGVLTMTAVLRLATGVLQSKYGFERRILVQKIAKVKWRKYISPGDQVHIEIQVLSLDEAGAKAKGKVMVQNKPVATIGEIQFRFDDDKKIDSDLAKSFWASRGFTLGGEG